MTFLPSIHDEIAEVRVSLKQCRPQGSMTLDEVASKIAVEYSEALEILGSEGGEQWH